MKCFLCMKSLPEIGVCVCISSRDGQRLDVKNIIEQHFNWLQVNIFDNENSNVCHQCWQILYDFHDLYERVEQAHKLQERQYTKTSNSCHISQRTTTAATAKATPATETLPPSIPPSNRIKTPYNIKKVSVKLRRLHIPMSQQSKELMKIQRLQQSRVTKNEITSTQTERSNYNIDSKNIAMFRYILDKTCEVVAKPVSRQCKQIENISKVASTVKQYDVYIAKHFNLSCCLCNVQLENFAALKSHFENEHQVRGYVLCCGRKLMEPDVLVDHLRKHPMRTFFKCTRCRKVLKSRRQLEVHVRRFELHEEPKYKCEICAKRFYLRSSYLKHKFAHRIKQKNLKSKQKITAKNKI